MMTWPDVKVQPRGRVGPGSARFVSRLSFVEGFLVDADGERVSIL